MLPAGAYAGQLCNAVLSACPVVHLWYPGVSGLCVHELVTGQNTDTSLPIRIYVQHKTSCTEPGKPYYPLPPNTKLWALGMRATSQCSDRAQTSTSVSGRASRVDAVSVLPKSARANRYARKNTNISQSYLYLPYTLVRSKHHIRRDNLRTYE